MNIPDYLKEEIRAGNAVLFFGAGASYGAKNDSGKNIPMGNELRDLICDKFLGGKYKDYSLDMAAGFAVSQADVRTVQDFIRDILVEFKPAEYHKLIPTFRWKLLLTTNYDLIIERAYEQVSRKVQKLVPFISDEDKIRDAIKDGNALKYVKLHGCITKTDNCACPLILTRSQYGNHKYHRERLYGELYNIAHEHPIIFIGHSVQDTDLMEVINRLRSNNIPRPNFYLVIPEIDEIKSMYLQQQLGIHYIVGTFEEFIYQLNQYIPSDFRGIPFSNVRKRHPFLDVICSTKTPISDETASFLNNEIDYIHIGFKAEQANPIHFYKGIDCGWGAIEQELDVERTEITESIIIENALDLEPGNGNFRFAIINAPAGAGKSVLLKRIAWKISHEYNLPVIFLKNMGEIKFNAVHELLEVSDKHIYFFIDNAANHIKFFSFLPKIKKEFLNKITIIAAERTNEWNMCSEDLTTLPIKIYTLENLNYKETQKLLDTLDKYDSLGELAKYERQEQVDKLVKQFDKQLLVALYESTKGKSFEEIIKDEYNNIFPEEARKIYLVVCILNRLNIPVRAGLINSIFNINFADFKRKFFNPLAEIVITKEDKRSGDLYYLARHPYIAEIVFEQILSNIDDRFNRFIEVLKTLNIIFESDEKAFSEMIKANRLLGWFNRSHDMIKQIYDYAKASYADNYFVLQQMAIYEFKRPNSNLAKAKEYLALAENLAPKSVSVKHTKAELYLKLAENTIGDLEFEKLLNDAYKCIEEIQAIKPPNTYCYSTLIKIEMLKLKRSSQQNSNYIDRIDINGIVERVEKNLYKSLQLFPNSPVLLNIQAEYANLIGNQERYIESLEKAFECNHRNKYIVQNLVRYYQGQSLFDTANAILDKAINADHADTKLKYLKAKNLYMMDEEGNRSTILYLLEKCSVSNEANYDSKILYGRELFIAARYEEAKEIFFSLRDVLINEEAKMQLHYVIKNKYYGHVESKWDNYIFIRLEGYPRPIFAHKNDSCKLDLSILELNTKISFNVGFTFKGPVAINIENVLNG